MAFQKALSLAYLLALEPVLMEAVDWWKDTVNIVDSILGPEAQSYKIRDNVL